MTTGLLQRPIYGGVFGTGRYALATLPCVSRGLHAVRYMVIEQQGGSVLSIAEDKLAALAGARRLLHAASAPDDGDRWLQSQLWDEGDLPAPLLSQAARPVSRRRRDIFERSGGMCHYCRAGLALDGRWHIEHMVPRALDGSDGPLNLVAACTACNLAKRDRTALEFVIETSAM